MLRYSTALYGSTGNLINQWFSDKSLLNHKQLFRTFMKLLKWLLWIISCYPDFQSKFSIMSLVSGWNIVLLDDCITVLDEWVIPIYCYFTVNPSFLQPTNGRIKKETLLWKFSLLKSFYSNFCFDLMPKNLMPNWNDNAQLQSLNEF